MVNLHPWKKERCFANNRGTFSSSDTIIQCPHCFNPLTLLFTLGNGLEQLKCKRCDTIWEEYPNLNIDETTQETKKKEEPMDLSKHTCPHCYESLIRINAAEDTPELYQCIACKRGWEVTSNPDRVGEYHLHAHVFSKDVKEETKLGCPYCDSVDIHQYPPPTGFCDFKCNTCGECWSISDTKPKEEPEHTCPNCQRVLTPIHSGGTTWECKGCVEVWSLHALQALQATHPKEEAISGFAEDPQPMCLFCDSAHTELYTPLRTPERTNPSTFVKCLDCSSLWPLDFKTETPRPFDPCDHTDQTPTDSKPLIPAYYGLCIVGEPNEAWKVTCPCGVSVSYPINKIPTVDTQMPCGNPDHYAVKYVDDIPLNSRKAYLWKKSKYTLVPFASLKKDDVFALTEHDGLPAPSPNGSLASIALSDAYTTEEGVFGIKSENFISPLDKVIPADEEK